MQAWAFCSTACRAGARAELETILAQWRTRAFGARASEAPTSANGFLHAPSTTGHRLRIDPLWSEIVGNATTAVWILEGAVGARLTIAGLAIGVAIALAAGRALTSLLFGVTATDPTTLAGVVALIGGVALGACYLPGLSATRVDPIVALREE